MRFIDNISIKKDTAANHIPLGNTAINGVRVLFFYVKKAVISFSLLFSSHMAISVERAPSVDFDIAITNMSEVEDAEQQKPTATVTAGKFFQVHNFPEKFKANLDTLQQDPDGLMALYGYVSYLQFIFLLLNDIAEEKPTKRTIPTIRLKPHFARSSPFYYLESYIQGEHPFFKKGFESSASIKTTEIKRLFRKTLGVFVMLEVAPSLFHHMIVPDDLTDLLESYTRKDGALALKKVQVEKEYYAMTKDINFWTTSTLEKGRCLIRCEELFRQLITDHKKIILVFLHWMEMAVEIVGQEVEGVCAKAQAELEEQLSQELSKKYTKSEKQPHSLSMPKEPECANTIAQEPILETPALDDVDWAIKTEETGKSSTILVTLERIEKGILERMSLTLVREEDETLRIPPKFQRATLGSLKREYAGEEAWKKEDFRHQFPPIIEEFAIKYGSMLIEKKADRLYPIITCAYSLLELSICHLKWERMNDQGVFQELLFLGSPNAKSKHNPNRLKIVCLGDVLEKKTKGIIHRFIHPPQK